MVVWVEREGVKYPCKSEEQLELFLSKGYKQVEEKKPVKKVIKKDK